MAADDDLNAEQSYEYRVHGREGGGGRYTLFRGENLVGLMGVSKRGVRFLHAAQGHQVAAMTMLGIAANRYEMETGTPLQNDTSDLSPHSARLANAFAERGVGEGGAEANNARTWIEPQRITNRDKHGDVINELGVAAGRQKIRSVARRRDGRQ